MNGVVSGINYSLLFGSESSANADAAILTALFSGGTSATPRTSFVSSGNPISDLKLAQQQETAGIAQTALQPQVANAINAFKASLANAATIQNALLNPNVQKVLLTANGLSSYIGETALNQKLLLSDPADPRSLVNQFGNSTWLATVQTYNFAKKGLAELRDPKVIATLTQGYAEVRWRMGLDQATPGLSNAIAFLGQASSIKSVDDILTNVTNFVVVTTALGIPLAVLNQDETAQKSAITSRLDIAKLQDRQFVTSLTDQYLLIMQQNGTTNAGTGAGNFSLTSLAVQASGLVI